MNNIPEIKLGIVAVSRDCFPVELSKTRRQKVAAACRKLKLPVVEIDPVIENERDALAALDMLEKKGVNALVCYLGNFGPEGPTTLLAQRFAGPVMFAAAAEENRDSLIDGRGDAYCGLLNVSYNVGLRRLRPYLPEYPVGTPDEVAAMIREFVPVARILLGLRRVKVFSFGPRPQDFLACHAPIQPLYDLGVEVMENSELDLYDIVRSAAGHRTVPAIAGDMAKELGKGNAYPELIPKLAQFEAALMEFMDQNLGASRFGIFANKCWPAFEKFFGHVPCYVNSRLAARGIPVACETDIYGAVSEYMAICANEEPATILDINNTVPADMIAKNKAKIGAYEPTDLFMGFHCGNTPAACMVKPQMKYQLIMNRLIEEGREPDITRGTLEGQLKKSPMSIFRLQATSDAELKAYVANGEILDIDPASFGCIGVFAVSEMGRFYRHVLLEKHFPHHTAVAFGHAGKALFAAAGLLGVRDISFNRPRGMYYPTENPF